MRRTPQQWQELAAKFPHLAAGRREMLADFVDRYPAQYLAVLNRAAVVAKESCDDMDAQGIGKRMQRSVAEKATELALAILEGTPADRTEIDAILFEVGCTDWPEADLAQIEEAYARRAKNRAIKEQA